MTKKTFIKGQNNIYTFGLTNLNLEFRVIKCDFEERVSNF